MGGSRPSRSRVERQPEDASQLKFAEGSIGAYEDGTVDSQARDTMVKLVRPTGRPLKSKRRAHHDAAGARSRRTTLSETTPSPQARVGFGGAALYAGALCEGECSTVGLCVCCPTTSNVSANCRDALVGDE